MKIDTFANRLKKALEIREMKQYELANKSGIGKSAISQYLNGKYEPKQTAIYKLAEALNVNESWLMGYEIDIDRDSNRFDALGNPVVSIPILGTVKAGYNYLAQENWIGAVDVSANIAKNKKEYFALKVTGDSMYPDFKENDVVVVKKQNDFVSGDIVVALINGDEATIKKGIKSSGSLLLQPTNPLYEPMIFNENDVKRIPVEIIGVVKQLQRQY